MVKKKEENSYLFPNFMAKIMKGVEMKTQLEASMLSMSLLLLGMILMSVYSILYLDQGLAFKILLVFNLLAGFIFMSSFLVTTFQQYNSYLSVMQLQDLQPPKKSRRNQFLFFFGLLIICASVVPMFLSELPTYILDNRYYILGGGILIGILLIFSAVRKKNRPNKEIIQVNTNEQITPQEQEEIKKQEEVITQNKKIIGDLKQKTKIVTNTKVDPKKEERIRTLIKALQQSLDDIERMKTERR